MANKDITDELHKIEECLQEIENISCDQQFSIEQYIAMTIARIKTSNREIEHRLKTYEILVNDLKKESFKDG